MFEKIINRLTSLQGSFGYRKAFLSKRQFERTVARERIRAARRGIPFCIVSFQLLESRPHASSKVARTLLRNLRLTDEKAIFATDELAALLVDTTHFGGRAVVDRLSLIFAEQGIPVSLELEVHVPSSDESNARDSDGGSSFERTPMQPEVVVVGGGTTREGWTKTATLHSDASPMTNRRTVELDSRTTPTSQRTNEIISSTAPLAPGFTFDQALKRGIDIVGASVGLFLLSPLLLLSMALIRITSPGPPIFRQTREGLRGKAFTIYKLRTMVVGAECSQQTLRDLSHRDGPAFKIKADPRVTRIGKFLRATCIDELPQLVNVLLGDMSLVGPRPLPWHESRACNHWHRRRLDVLPGLTCFWQINKASVETFDEWMRLDLRYVDHRNLWVDITLIFRTVAVTLLGRGSH